MNILITITAVVILLTGVYFNRVEKPFDKPDDTTEVLSETDLMRDTLPLGSEPVLTLIPTATETPSPTETTVPSTSVTIIQEDNSQSTSSFSLESFKYPNASIVSDSSDSIMMKTPENAQTVTTWYKSRINSFGMNVTSFVTTNTNDTILNKLAGAGSEGEVSVAISKSPTDNEVTIEVSP